MTHSWSEKIPVTYQEWLDCMCGRQVREEVQQKILSQIADPDSELVQYVKRREELHRRVAHGQIDWVAMYSTAFGDVPEAARAEHDAVEDDAECRAPSDLLTGNPIDQSVDWSELQSVPSVAMSESHDDNKRIPMDKGDVGGQLPWARDVQIRRIEDQDGVLFVAHVEDVNELASNSRGLLQVNVECSGKKGQMTLSAQQHIDECLLSAAQNSSPRVTWRIIPSE